MDDLLQRLKQAADRDPSLARLLGEVQQALRRLHHHDAPPDLWQRNEQLAALHESGQALSRLVDPADIPQLIFTQIGRVLDNSDFFLALYDEEQQLITFPVYMIQGLPRAPVIYSRPFGNGVTEYVLRTRRPLLIRNRVAETLNRLGVQRLGRPTQCLLAVPMLAADRVLGVLSVQDYERENVYDESHLELLATFASQAASALENARLYALAQQTVHQQNAILDGLPAQIAVLDAAGVVLRVNRHWKDYTGGNRLFGPSAAVGVNYIELCSQSGSAPLPALAQAAEGIRAVLAGRSRQFEMEYPCHLPDGTRWFQLMITPLPVRERIGAVVMHVDLTQRKLAEECSQRNQELYRQLFESDLAGNFITTPAGNIVACNLAFARIFGYATVGEALQANVRTWYPDPEQRTQLLAELKQHRSLPHQHIELRRRDGRVVQVLMSVVGQFDARGELQQISGSLFDDTERQQLEVQLRQAQRLEAVGRLAGGIAHDFNNLLTVILGYTDLVLAEIHPRSELRQLLEEVKASGLRAAALTSQLLAFSRRQILQPRTLDLNMIVRSMEALLRRALGERIEFSTVLSDQLPPVRVDPGQMEQALMNLVLNARDAMPDGGRLRIETSPVELTVPHLSGGTTIPPGTYTVLTITDTGCGMDEETQARIFEPFFTTKEIGKGVGLGLAMVYGFVQQSGGLLTVQSALGEGTTMCVYLPRAEPQVRSHIPAPTIETRLSRGTETVLLAEDADGVRNLVCLTLQHHGYHVLTARSGEEALQVSKEHPGSIPLLITDVIMPGMTGRELADQLVVQRPDLKVLYISGHTDEAIGRHGVLEPGVHFLQKPFTPKTLLHKVRDLLQRRTPTE